MADDGRAALRRELRAARRAVDETARAAAAVALVAQLARLGLPRPGARIAAYLPLDGEIDPSAVLARARARRCAIHLPVITDWRSRRMRLVPEAELFRRPVPDDSARWLDLVLVPLVAFDAGGNRLGMGAGFYDRHFAFLRARRAWRRPRLLGLGFELQRVTALAPAPHDVPLWGVVTERAVYGAAARCLD
ncbi:MAG: 5-formyltetrahydrofolate cyclo-ligase [Gammaproteobacteria bacterium]|nr:5-formyltetrahydrofolate cyclo-ligase [Gammaproteobacteria bacterium]